MFFYNYFMISTAAINCIVNDASLVVDNNFIEFFYNLGLALWAVQVLRKAIW